jgi:uncharacterized membrane protein YdbT with pleckstrin-like domain
MVRCKNAGGAPGDGDDSPPRRTEIARGKRIKIMAKKKKKTLTEAEIAQAVADAAEQAERWQEQWHTYRRASLSP